MGNFPWVGNFSRREMRGRNVQRELSRVGVQIPAQNYKSPHAVIMIWLTYRHIHRKTDTQLLNSYTSSTNRAKNGTASLSRLTAHADVILDICCGCAGQ